MLEMYSTFQFNKRRNPFLLEMLIYKINFTYIYLHMTSKYTDVKINITIYHMCINELYVIYLN